MTDAVISLFGIRHHGPGSARSVRAELRQFEPDVLLVEGPPEGDVLLPLLAHPDMRPPVALLIYAPQDLQKAVYYPFALFSPEWQAIQYGLSQQLPVRFIDLPLTHYLALEKTVGEDAAAPLRQDPLGELAQTAGYADGERWWEQMVEQRQDSGDIFAAIVEVMTALRQAQNDEPDERELFREAAMRQSIRQAQKEGFKRIAVVCGAWHTPALMPEALFPVNQDQALLKNLPKLKVEATWVPWTHGRLTLASGYGAGVRSPGWYHHLWSNPQAVATSWLTKVAHFLREQDLDASPAQVIDGVRLAETLAALRGRAIPGLEELTEATLSVFCQGNDIPLRLIHDQLIVGETIGEVPDETPMVPLQQDLQAEQKRLRLRPEAGDTTLNLDLRQKSHLERSHLLHRLRLLGVVWGQKETIMAGQGTFHEVWRLRWTPELMVRLIERSVWGNTVVNAAAAYVTHQAQQENHLPSLTTLVYELLQADLPLAVIPVVQRLQDVAALTGDVQQLMASLYPLVDVLLYGNVRQTDAGMVRPVVDGLITRLCIGLPMGCQSLAEEAAKQMLPLLNQGHSAIRLLDDATHLANWYGTLNKLMSLETVSGLIRGRSCRFLFDTHQLTVAETAQQLRLALVPHLELQGAAAWLQGFLEGSGLILVHNSSLLTLLDEWLTNIPAEAFQSLLPLLRRTFATFASPERKQIGQLIKGIGQKARGRGAQQPLPFDEERGALILPILAQLLGVPFEPERFV